MAAQSLSAAVAELSQDTGRTLSVARKVGALERAALLDTLRRLNIARWAVVLHRLASDPRHDGEFSPDDVEQARRLARTLAVEVAA